MPSTFFGDDLTLVQIGQHAIERDHSLVVGNGLVDLVGDLATCSFGSAWKLASTIFIFCEADQPSVTATFVSASSLIVPIAGLSRAAFSRRTRR